MMQIHRNFIPEKRSIQLTMLTIGVIHLQETCYLYGWSLDIP